MSHINWLLQSNGYSWLTETVCSQDRERKGEKERERDFRGGEKSPPAVMVLPRYIINGASAWVQIAGHTTENNVHQKPGTGTPERCCSISLRCGIKKLFRMDVTIKVSVLDEEPEQFHWMAPESEVYFNFTERYILYVRDWEARWLNWGSKLKLKYSSAGTTYLLEG